MIRAGWHAACDLAELTSAERARRWGSEFCNPFALYDYTRQTTLTPGGTPPVAGETSRRRM